MRMKVGYPVRCATSRCKHEIIRRQDELAPQRAQWLRRGAYFHKEDLLYLKFLIPEGVRVLEVGCGTGHLLASLKPSFGIGIDISPRMIAEASMAYPSLTFLVGDIDDKEFLRSLPGPFDVILIADTLGEIGDCQDLFQSLHALSTRKTRAIVAYLSH